MFTQIVSRVSRVSVGAGTASDYANRVSRVSVDAGTASVYAIQLARLVLTQVRLVFTQYN